MTNPSQNTQRGNAPKNFDLTIPLMNGGELPIELKCGETLFLLGLNGSGKSSLLVRWLRQVPASYRIAANRDLFFSQKEIYAERGSRFNEKAEHSDAGNLRWSVRSIYGDSAYSKRSHILTEIINT